MSTATMTLLRNGMPLCEVSQIQDNQEREFITQFGSLAPLTYSSVFRIKTPADSGTGLGVKHAVEFAEQKKRWYVEIHETFQHGDHFHSKVVFLEDQDL